MILEESENLDLHRIATVRSERGEEFRIDLDAAACALGQLFSDHDNERKRGWQLNAGWWQEEFAKLRDRVTVRA